MNECERMWKTNKRKKSFEIFTNISKESTGSTDFFSGFLAYFSRCFPTCQIPGNHFRFPRNHWWRHHFSHVIKFQEITSGFLKSVNHSNDVIRFPKTCQSFQWRHQEKAPPTFHPAVYLCRLMWKLMTSSLITCPLTLLMLIQHPAHESGMFNSF